MRDDHLPPIELTPERRIDGLPYAVRRGAQELYQQLRRRGVVRQLSAYGRDCALALQGLDLARVEGRVATRYPAGSE